MTAPISSSTPSTSTATVASKPAWLSAVTNVVSAILGKVGVPAKVRPTIVHIVAVFAVAFVAQICFGAFHTLSFSAGWQLLVAAATAGGSAVVHHLLGILKIKL